MARILYSCCGEGQGHSSRVLTITTDCPELATPLAETSGTVFFKNPRHFLDEQALALWSLQGAVHRADIAVDEVQRTL